MTTFSFRLQPLMKLREAERDRRREELAEAYRAGQVLTERRDALLGEKEETRRLSRHKSRPGPIQVEILLDTNRYELLLTTQLSQLAQQQEKVEAEIERRRQTLAAADQQVRILEKLRERHADEHRQKEQKLEASQLDEIALRRQYTVRRSKQ